MKICEGCIKQDVCKFKDEVGKYEKDKLPEPLVPSVACKHKETAQETVYIPYVPEPYYVYPYYRYPYYTIPDVTCTDPGVWTTTTCGDAFCTATDCTAIN